MGTRVAERSKAGKGQPTGSGALDERAAVGVLIEVLKERARQEAKWGQQNHPDGTGREDDDRLASLARTFCNDQAAAGQLTWRDILEEEVFEAFAETDREKLRAELLQVSAVAAAWAEAIDRRGT